MSEIKDDIRYNIYDILIYLERGDITRAEATNKLLDLFATNPIFEGFNIKS